MPSGMSRVTKADQSVAKRNQPRPHSSEEGTVTTSLHVSRPQMGANWITKCGGFAARALQAGAEHLLGSGTPDRLSEVMLDMLMSAPTGVQAGSSSDGSES